METKGARHDSDGRAPEDCFAGSRVLLLVDSFSREASGGMVARFLAHNLRQWGADVRVVAVREDLTPEGRQEAAAVELVPATREERALTQIAVGRRGRRFREILREHRPGVVHVAALEIGKPWQFLDAARETRARLVLQTWGYTFYCAQGYDYLKGRTCGLCANGRFVNAYRMGCERRALVAAVGAVGRTLLRRASAQGDVAIASCHHMKERLEAFGVPSERILRLPVPFDGRRLAGLEPRDEGYVAFLGQPTPAKGIAAVEAAVRECQSTRFELFFTGDAPAVERLRQMGPRVRVETNLRWHTGVAERIAHAGIVLAPSLWATPLELALYEAMGLSKAVVAFKVGAHRDYLQDGREALVAEEGDIAGFVERVRLLEAQPELRVKLGTRARQALEEMTDVRRLRATLARAYFGDLGGISWS